MKRLIAGRRIKNPCHCGRVFNKGDVYYKIRNVTKEDGIIYACEYLECPKCMYKSIHHANRRESFHDKCTHPEKFVDTQWDYIPGEAVKEPQYDWCRLCGEKF